MLLEPIQGESGVHVLADDAAGAARAACDARRRGAGVRRGADAAWGAPARCGPTSRPASCPDAMTLAKALGGGLPIGALVIGPRLADVLRARATTARRSPAARWSRAAALRGARRDRRPGAAARACASSASGCAEGLRELPGVRRRARARADGRAPRSTADAPERRRARALLEQRLVINATGPTTLRFLPPLVVTEAEIDEALRRVAAVL